MAGVLIRMRLALLRNSLRGDRAAGFVTGVVVGLLLATGTIAVAVLWPALLPMALAGWLMGWVFGPLFTGGGDETLRPEYFTMIPATSRRLTTGLLAGAFAGPAPAITMVALLSLPVHGWRYGPLAVLTGLVAAVLTLVTMVLLSRIVVASFGLLVRSRLSAVLAAIVTGTLLAMAGNGWALAVAFGMSDDTTWFETPARILPSGWGVAAVEAPWPFALGLPAANGLVIVLLWGAWSALLARRVVSATRGGVPRRRGGPRPFPRAGGARAVAAKELRTWSRDLTRINMLTVAFTYAVVFCFLPVAIGWWGLVPFAGVIAIVMSAAASANLYGTDGTALWLTLMTPGAERLDVRGRQLAWLLTVGPAAVLLSLAGTALGDQTWAWPWVLSLLPAVLGGAAGLVVLVAVTSPVPATDPHKRGGNPLSTGADEGGETALAWLMLFAVPATALPAAAAVLVHPWAGAPVGVATGALCAWWFGRIAQDRLETGGTELLNLMKHGTAPRHATPRASKPAPDLPLVHRIGVTFCYSLAWLPLFPQGLVPLVLKIVETQDPSWFLALHLPQAWQWPTIIFMISLGLAMHGYAILIPLRYPAKTEQQEQPAGRSAAA
jgi:ABC-2 type transport system permease protein